MRFVVVREGRALLKIPDIEQARAPHGLEPAWLPVFYNPRMTYNRDVSVLALAVYVEAYAPHRPVHAVDALSGTGVRAVRYALEVPQVEPVHANDIDPVAYSLIRENAELNNVEGRVRAHNDDANALLIKLRREEPLLFVDIDPFGSPAPFTLQAVRATGHRGMAAFTATDLAVLEGAKARAARRKYWADLARTPESKEVGLRVLLGYIARAAAFNDKSVRPLLAYHADHYYRVYVLVERGARRADRMLEENLGPLYYCPQAKRADLQPSCSGGEPQRLGPIWSGPLWDTGFLDLMIEALEKSYGYLETLERARRLLTTLRAEAGVCERCIFYRLDAVASANRVNVPKISRVVEELQARGYRAVRSHFHPVGIRTDAPYEEVVDTISRLSSR